ncbi:MAG TPA: hypothetical protein V6C90_19850 [Coleofasciculaceae cyanobacterium]
MPFSIDRLDQGGTNNPEGDILPLSPSSALEVENFCQAGLVHHGRNQ